jgi:predicted phosphodiesterase
MKIQYVSDVHTEFHKDLGIQWAKTIPVEGDVLVLAGDIVIFENLIQVLTIICNRFSKVVFVSGNHEYYRSDRKTIHNKLQKIANKFDNFHHLNNNVVVIEDIRFVGTTLWWSAPPYAWLAIMNGLNDFSQILGYRKWVSQANIKAKQFLQENVREGDIVITHHAPTWEAHRRRQLGNGVMHFAYYNNLDDLILDNKPKYWIYGHTHHEDQFSIGDTLLVNSPHDYCPYEGGWPKKFGLLDV